MNRRFILTIVLLCLFLVSATTTWAQFVQRGGIEGTVFDASGAVVQNAPVKLLDVAENQSKEIKANAAGHFEFDNLNVGQYKLTVSQQGFQTESSELITVNIGKVEHYDFKLRPGSAQETVTVSAESSGLETDQASLDTNVSAQQIEDLPLNGRNFTSIAALAPGVATTPQLNINPGGTYAVGAMFAMGGTVFTTGGIFEGDRDNGFYINGVNITENYESTISFEPAVEALATGTVGVSDFSAANGHDISNLTMQTKGGTTKFHGEAYDFLENTDLNAVNPWLNASSEYYFNTPAIKPTVERNQYGGNFGGPLYIPKLLSKLKDKAFFFVNLENDEEADGNLPTYGSVPSAAELTGNFSELLSSPQAIQLYNPFFTTYDASGQSSRPAIPNNRLDQATRADGSPLIDPNALAIQKALWPVANIPNQPSDEPNYVYLKHQGFSNYHIDTRFDGQISSHDSVFVTWSRSQGTSNYSGNITPADLSNLYILNNFDQSWLVTGNYVHIFTPQLTNELTFGLGHGYLEGPGSPSQFSFMNSSANPFNQLFQNTGSGATEGILLLTAGNYLSPGVFEPFGDSNRTTQLSDNLDWNRGRHSIKAGLSYLRKGEYDWQIGRYVAFGSDCSYCANGFASPGFSGGATLQNFTPGDGMADLEMGIPSAINQRFNFTSGGTAPDSWEEWPDWGMYVDDTFHVSPALTISAGLRYELDIPIYAPNSICCAVYSPTSDGGVLKVPGVAPGVPQHFISVPKGDFAPRVSIAYSVNPRTVIRAGFGIFYDAGATQISSSMLTAQDGIPGYFYGTSVNNSTLGALPQTPVMTFANVFPAPVTLSPGQFPVQTGVGQGYYGANQYNQAIYFDQKSAPLPYFQRMMLDFQHQFGGHDSFTLSYAGAQGRKGWNEMNINLPPYQTNWAYGGGVGDPTFNAARPNNAGRFGDIYVWRPMLNSFYNAAIVQYKHDFNKGFQLTSNYTWGKTVSDYPWSNNVDSGFAGGYNASTGFQYRSSVGSGLYDRGEMTHSHRHRFVYSGIWEPKYGGNWPSYLKEPLSGWRIAGTGTFESGDIYTIYNTYTSALDDAGVDEMFVSGNANLSHGQKAFARQFDTSKFTAPQEGVRGNSGLGTIRGPGQNNLDLSIAKTFPINDKLRLEFRADAFNALNHTQWNSINTYYYPGYQSILGGFGSVNGAREGRIGQVAAKLVF